MSENNELKNEKTNLQTQSNNNLAENLDMENNHTYSNKNFDNIKIQNFGSNKSVDIGKFNSRMSAYECETNERKNLVDKLFDESISYDIAKQEEFILNSLNNNNNDENKISNKEIEKRVHLFTESAQELSVRGSDLFGFEKKHQLNLDENKNVHSALNFGYNPNVSEFANSSNSNNNNTLLPNNRYINGDEGNDSNFVPAYGNSKEINIDNANNFNNEKYIYKDKVVDKSYLVSRLFSDDINTEQDQNVNFLNESSLADKTESVNEKKIEPPKIFSTDNIIKSINENNFRTHKHINVKNPFDDTEDQIQSHLQNESVNIAIERANSNKLINSNINISINKNDCINHNINNINLDERISFNNPNFTVNNLDNSNHINRKEVNEDLNKNESGTVILAKLSGRPFKSINFADHEAEANISEDKNDKINLNNFNSFDKNNNNINLNKNINNNLNETLSKDMLENLGPASINNISNNEYLTRNASIPFTKSLLEKSIDELKEIDTINAVSIIDKKANEKFNEIPAAIIEADRASKYNMSSQNPFMESDKINNFDKSKKNFKDESDFNLLGADDSKGEINLEKANSMKLNKNKTLEKKNTQNILEEIDIEFDNDKLNEDNNFNFDLGLNNKSIKKYNDLEFKNQIRQNNQNNDVDASNFNSKDFKNFDFDSNKVTNIKNQADNFFGDEKNNNIDFYSNIKNEVLLTKAEKPKLEIKFSSNNSNNDTLYNKNSNSEKISDEKINTNFEMFKDFDKNRIINKNFDFDFSAEQPPHKTSLNHINSNTDQNLFKFEIKNNLNNPNGNYHASLPVNPSSKIANGEYYNEQAQQRLLGKDSVLSQTQEQSSERAREKTAEELMQKNQNINFDKIIFDVFDKKKEKKPKVNFDQDYENDSNNNNNDNNKNKNLIPADYINLDDFQSGKMNEYNNQAVDRNIQIDNSIDAEINFIEEAEIPNIDNNDSLYMESKRDDYMQNNNGIFISYSDKHEKPFGKISALSAKKIDFLKRKTKLINDNMFSDEKSFAKINKNNLDSLALKKHFAYDAEVLVSQVEEIFLDLFQNYDFDHLKKKLKTPTKDARWRAEAKISYLQTISIFKANANLTNFNAIKLKTFETNAKYVRKIKSDGNGFYRCFMFALVESFILNENVAGIRNILIDVNEIIDLPLSNSLEVNKQEIFGIFNCILENLELNNISNAYAVFINAYGFSSNFDNCMIKYMRLALKKFISQNDVELIKTNKYPHIKGTFPEEYYLSADKQSLDLKSYFKDRLLNLNFEADLAVISLAPIVFESSLDLFVLEGINNENFSDVKVLTQHIPAFSHNAENQIIFENLKILYQLGRYSVIYSNQVSAKFEFNRKFELEKFINNEKFSDKISVIADFKCDDCRSDTKIIQIKKFNDLSFCENCLKSFLKRVIGKRIKNLNQENFLNAEYYCRPILIDEKGKFPINDDDFMFLFKSTIPKFLLNKFDSVCSICQNPEESNQQVKLNCSCSFCEKCLINFIDKATDGKIFMNIFEKRNFLKRGSNNVLCQCGIPFDTELAITIKYPITDNLLKKANERLASTCKNTCVYCLKDLSQLKSKQKVPGENPAFYILKVKPENHEKKSVSNEDHIICKSCCSSTLKNYLSNLIRKKMIKIKDNTYPIECAICEIMHQVDSANLTKIMKSEGGCCEIL